MLVFIYLMLGLVAGVAVGFVLGQTATKAQVEEEERPWKTAYETLQSTNKTLDEENNRLRELILRSRSEMKQ